VDGIVFTPTGKNADYINGLIESGMSIVLLDRLIDGVDCDAVLINNEMSAYKAVKHLIDNGYRKIGIITGYIDRTTGRERLNGYLRAINEAGIKRNDNFIKIGDFKEKSGLDLTKELFQGRQKPDSLFVSNVDMTIGALIATQELGIDVPGDIGIVGFDDFEWARLLKTPLTAIRQPVYSLGLNATEMLLKKINNEPLSIGDKSLIITLSTELIIRKSTKKLYRKAV